MGIILLLTALDYLARDVLQSIYHPVKVLTSVNDAFYRHWRCSGYGIHLIKVFFMMLLTALNC